MKKLVILLLMSIFVTFSSTVSASVADLSNVFSDLSGHITGSSSLSGPQIESRTATFEANKNFLADTTAIMTEAFNLSSLYETTKGPLFINSKTSGGFPRDGSADGYELERAILAIQQAILEVIYTPSNCQTYQSLLDGKIFETSDYFPGACTSPADPNVSYSIDINATLEEVWGKPVAFATDPARRPTGCYLAPGSIAAVTVPASMVNKGFEILVGAHTRNKSNKSTIKRIDRISRSFPITTDVTTIANPLGGGIYIDVPYQADLGVVTIQIKNVVRSPYFAATSTKHTPLQEWIDTERKYPGPWADFETDKFMMQVPASWIYNYSDPNTQMEKWDMAMDGMSELFGFPLVRNRTVLYVQPDVSIAHGAYGIGYPQINQTYNPKASTNGNSSHFFLTNPIGWSTTYHELGHAQLFSKFPGHTEATVNLPYVYIATEKFGVDLVTAFTNSMKLGHLQNMNVDQAALTWFVTPNFRDGKPMNITNTEMNEVRYQHRGYGMYVDMAEMFGWDVFKEFYHQESLDYMASTPGDGLDLTDSRILRFSKIAGVDLTALFHTWGVHPKNPDALRQAIIDESLPKSMELYTRLLHYKDIIPADNAGFWDHYTTIYPSQPSGGNPNYQYGWYNEWKNVYNETHGTAAKNAMQYIIDLYFDQDVTPPSPDPMTWASAPAPVSDSSITMTASVAADDLNAVEYYFTCTAGGGHDSGWQASNKYTDISLTRDTQYTYTVMVRDTSRNFNQTASSSAESATTYSDPGPPTPNPPTFASAPTAISDTKIVMTATTGQDGSGPVEYYFDEVSGNPGGTDSGWTINPVYTDTGLNPDTRYSYTVQMRDALFNTGNVSAPVSTTTPLAGTIQIDVPNGDFAVYKPGTAIRGTCPSDIWVTQIGLNRPLSGSTPVPFDDGTTGTVVDVPGWITPIESQGIPTGNCDLWSRGYNAGDGTSCLNAFGEWSSQNGGLAKSAESLGNIDSDRIYKLSAMLLGNAGPVTLELQADGVTIPPSSAVTPVAPGNWQVISRSYNMADLAPYVGQPMTIVVGIARPGPGDPALTGARARFDNIKLEYYAFGPDIYAPTPDPMGFVSAPAVTATTSISMTALTAFDRSGVEYYFTCTAGGGSDSGWQDSPIYTDSGLSPDVTYSYTVKARDKSASTFQTGQSEPASALIDLKDGRAGLSDFALFAAQWLKSDCGFCTGADLTDDGNVNMDDLYIFFQNWLAD